MDNNSTEDASKISRENSSKELNNSRSSIKSTKSLEKNTNTHSNTGSLKSDKDVHFAKSLKIKSEKHDSDNQKHNVDASLKVPHKIIANWRQACDRTRDRTRDLLKRWRTLPEFEAEVGDPSKKTLEKTDSQTENCGWSVHVWSTYYNLLQKL